MLYHVKDISRAIAELARIVAEDGVMIASTNSNEDKAELDWLWKRAAGDVLGVAEGPARLSLSARFPLEKAPELLAAVFSDVRVIALPGKITVRDPMPVIAHMESYQAWANRNELPFEETIERARSILAERIAANGMFEINCLGGILVCRR